MRSPRYVPVGLPSCHTGGSRPVNRHKPDARCDTAYRHGGRIVLRPRRTSCLHGRRGTRGLDFPCVPAEAIRREGVARGQHTRYSPVSSACGRSIRARTKPEGTGCLRPGLEPPIFSIAPGHGGAAQRFQICFFERFLKTSWTAIVASTVKHRHRDDGGEGVRPTRSAGFDTAFSKVPMPAPWDVPPASVCDALRLLLCLPNSAQDGAMPNRANAWTWPPHAYRACGVQQQGVFVLW